jgi:hypothetical protein
VYCRVERGSRRTAVIVVPSTRAGALLKLALAAAERQT